MVGNYLKGETPPPFDLLYWNSDSTNLPGPMYAWYLRNTYFENNLVKPGKVHGLRREGRPAARSTCRSTSTARARTTSCRSAAPMPRRKHLPGKKRFVMGASGHIAGVINPPAKNKRSYWTNDKLPDDARRVAGRRQGTSRQLVDRLVRLAEGPRGQADRRAQELRQGRKYKAIEPAPGRYVKAKA